MKPFDPSTATGVPSGDSSKSAPSGPRPRIQRGKGPLSFMAKTEILCQARLPHGGVCGRRLAVVAGEADVSDVTLSNLSFLGPGESGAYCPRCKRVSVYRMTERGAA